MDAPSRGSCTPKIPRTLANGELTMYSRSALLPQFGFVSPEASFDTSGSLQNALRFMSANVFSTARLAMIIRNDRKAELG